MPWPTKELEKEVLLASNYMLRGNDYETSVVGVSVDELRKLLIEREHLRDQVTSLQRRLTTYELEARALRKGKPALSGQVAAFNYAFGHKVRETPGIPDEKQVRLAMALVIEEAFEFTEACLISDIDSRSHAERFSIRHAKAIAMGAARENILNVNLPKVADALADLDYVSEAARQFFGIDGQPIADEVQISNMAKIGGAKDPETGKHLKPEGWTPPDIEACLRAQGWNPFREQMTMECGIPSETLPPCWMDWGHGGDIHYNASDGFHAREHDAEHHRRQVIRRKWAVKP